VRDGRRPAHPVGFVHSPPCLIVNSRVRTLSQIGARPTGGQQGEYRLIVVLLPAGVAPAYICTVRCDGGILKLDGSESSVTSINPCQTVNIPIRIILSIDSYALMQCHARVSPLMSP
jgi:hypothetical protein